MAGLVPAIHATRPRLTLKTGAQSIGVDARHKAGQDGSEAFSRRGRPLQSTEPPRPLPTASARQHDMGRQIRWDRLRHPIAKAW
jgi:hypothetical protein